jgi:hypothetical protein
VEARLTEPIDWQAPWFLPFAGVGQTVAARWCTGGALADALSAPAAAVTFVPQESLPAGEPYEAFIRRTGQCPTRDNLHDFFNGLCWHVFPRSKAQLNRIQSTEIAAGSVGAVRGATRDAATILDENGAALHAPAPLWDALLARDWRRLFVDLRPLWQEAKVTVFGHALLEKLVRPRKDLTAHVWNADLPPEAGGLDAGLAEAITPRRLAAKPFTPLPLLGIPGWCPGNENFSFYDDSQVFRSPGQNNEAQQIPRHPA